MANEDVDFMSLDQFVEYSKVQDRAFIGRLTNLVRIRDPTSGMVIATIRDPTTSIRPYQQGDYIIDM